MLTSGVTVPAGREGHRRFCAHRSTVALIAALLLLPSCDVPTGLPRIESKYLFPVDDLVLPVAGAPASATVDHDLSDIDLSDRVVGATLRITAENPTSATGMLAYSITGAGVTVAGSLDVAETGPQEIMLTEQEARALLGRTVRISASGTLCRAIGCGLDLPPFPSVTLKNEIELLVRLVGGG